MKYKNISNLKNWAVFAAGMTLASLCSVLLMRVSTSDFHVPMIFVLAVLVISMYTDGYFFGILASILSVPAVNWAFTYPYLEFNFSLSGYLVTFITMLAVGLATSLLSSRVKAQEQMRIESVKEKMRATLLRSISHDLRTPLTSVSGAITAVLDDDNPLPEEQKRQLLSDAKSEADWLCRMVDNLLSVTRISGAQSDIKKENELLEEVIAEASSNFQIRNPEVQLNIKLPDEPIFVQMDAMLIEQVIINLLDNAVIHGKTTSAIDIVATDNDDFVQISISDNGEGIDNSIIKHLFDGSLQFLPAIEDKNKNMGIGLQVCKTVIDAHSGEISACNLEHGAMFTFTVKK